MEKRRRLAAPFLALAALFALTACGGGGPTFPEVFLEENAWQGGVPSDARVVEPDEFRRMVGQGEVELTSTLMVEEAAATREAEFDENSQFLESTPDLSPALQDLLDALAGVEDFAGDQAFELPTGDSVVLEGLGTRVDNAVVITQLAASVDNA
ncbi:MAG TPA: hypothetical protein VFD39_08950, partial [Trueperaceae bacterium]|nr:hypothetical protein [Trueperaceae bacterium]